MKPYISLFNEDTNEGHSSMPRREKNTYISIYDQNFKSCRSSKKNMERNQGNGKKAKTIIPLEYSSIKESEDKTSKPNTIQPIFVFSIINGDNLSEILHGVMACIKSNAI